uniref:Homeodomain-like protein n=1 Tax=Tanacetum cinerariifolium TaxID=118510 RepID=A0A6L2M525_TANCI|nr:homeodomain-like protein [Tanacetum cinerariifolium]
MREMETLKFVLDHVSSELDSSDESTFLVDHPFLLDEEMDTNDDHKPIKKQKTTYNATKARKSKQENLGHESKRQFGHGESGTEVKVERNEMGPEKPKEQENGGVGSRRQGTRNRPPTAKALEAIANGLLTKDSKKKGKEDNVRRPRKRTSSRGEVGGAVSECSTGDASSGVKGDDEDGEIEYLG